MVLVMWDVPGLNRCHLLRLVTIIAAVDAIANHLILDVVIGAYDPRHGTLVVAVLAVGGNWPHPGRGGEPTDNHPPPGARRAFRRLRGY